MAVGAGLRMRGHEVILHDGPLENLPLGYEGYGFGPTEPEYPHAVGAAKRVKLHNPGSHIVLGGPYASVGRDKLSGEFDSVVVGDGEIVAHEAFTSNAKVVVGEERDLAEYPLPDRTLVDLRSYNFTMLGKPTTTLMSSRGCPYRCGFCCKTQKRVRLQEAGRVIEEINILQDNFGYDSIAFPEDVFILNRDRTERVCRHLRNQGIQWRCLVRADLIAKRGVRFVKMMRDSGCVGVGIGVESGSEKILQIIEKDESVTVMRQAIKMLKSVGIWTKGFFIVGLPGENEETLADTDSFLAEVQLDDIDCKIFQPYPGSPIHDNPEEYDIGWKYVPLGGRYYKGRPTEYHGSVYTSALTNQRIVEAWVELERKYKSWGKGNAEMMEVACG
jgi:radical SAM superfamily enzyme YgiQ (UPF0313 family)